MGINVPSKALLAWADSVGLACSEVGDIFPVLVSRNLLLLVQGKPGSLLKGLAWK